MHALSNILFSNADDGTHSAHSGENAEFACFAALSGAANPDLLDHLYDEENPVEFECLYSGDLEPETAFNAPYLARLEQGAPFTEWIFSGIGQRWGVMMLAPQSVDLLLLRRHLRKLSLIGGPNGKNMVLRYYDPGVLRHFLSVFEPKQLRQFFGPIAYFLAESDEPGKVLMFSLDQSDALQIREIAV